ncbi:MAG: hypothetical protein L0Z63_07740 [Actinobacteria bacterium]|nr:hypothetical protein [Actinomycetota bacterium]
MSDLAFDDTEVEEVFAALPREDPALRRLKSLLSGLSEGVNRIPSPERVESFASVAARISADTAGVGDRVANSPLRSRRMSRRLVLPLVTLLLLSAMTGVGVAANGALPGEALYGVDLALERAGLGAGGVEERLDEAAAMANRGDSETALLHAANAVAEGLSDHEETETVLQGLQTALLQLNDLPGGQREVTIRLRVAEMLQWMLDNTTLIGDDSQPGAFGRGVADIARQLHPDPEDEDGNDDQGASNTQDDQPSQSSGAAGGGPPASVTPGGPPSAPPVP